ncbi:MAG TPA: N-methyl-L-tryptophan oxidase, partial [Streptosporangiaceae bacterium]
MTYDVAVVGLGGMGSAAAYHLAARGHRVVGLERFGPAHDQGSSHGDSRIIRLAYFEHPSYVPLLRRAYELWRDTERASGRRLLTVTGGVFIGEPDAVTVTGALRSARMWDLDHEYLDGAGLARRFPTLRPGPDDVAVYEPHAGYVEPEATVRAHLDLAGRHGADLRFGERVTGWQAGGHGVRVTTDQGTYDADRLVVAAGAWAGSMLSDLSLPLAVERQVMHWFEPDDRSAFAAPDHPIYVWDIAGDQVYGFPIRPGDQSAKVAFFRRPNPTNPDHVDREVHESETAEIKAALSSRIPALRAHVAAKTCLYTLTPDHNFIIGPHPAHPNVVVAAGFSGHGFKFVPVVGEILTDLTETGTTPHNITLFTPTRPF